jgi:hypothetical protein
MLPRHLESLEGRGTGLSTGDRIFQVLSRGRISPVLQLPVCAKTWILSFLATVTDTVRMTSLAKDGI